MSFVELKKPGIKTTPNLAEFTATTVLCEARSNYKPG